MEIEKTDDEIKSEIAKNKAEIEVWKRLEYTMFKYLKLIFMFVLAVFMLISLHDFRKSKEKECDNYETFHFYGKKRMCNHCGNITHPRTSQIHNQDTIYFCNIEHYVIQKQFLPSNFFTQAFVYDSHKRLFIRFKHAYFWKNKQCILEATGCKREIESKKRIAPKEIDIYLVKRLINSPCP